MRHLHILPRFGDRWSHLYIERGSLEKESNSLALVDKEGVTPSPSTSSRCSFSVPAPESPKPP